MAVVTLVPQCGPRLSGGIISFNREELVLFFKVRRVRRAKKKTESYEQHAREQKESRFSISSNYCTYMFMFCGAAAWGVRWGVSNAFVSSRVVRIEREDSGGREVGEVKVSTVPSGTENNVPRFSVSREIHQRGSSILRWRSFVPTWSKAGPLSCDDDVSFRLGVSIR